MSKKKLDNLQSNNTNRRYREKEAEKLFMKHFKLVLSKFGHNNTTISSEVNNIGKKLFGKKFKGVYASDKLPNMKNKESLILNVDKSNQRGSHWVALIKHNNKVYIYDSFGRHSNRLFPHVTKKLGKYIDSDHDVEQKVSENNCAQRSMAWISLFYKYGPKIATLI